MCPTQFVEHNNFKEQASYSVYILFRKSESLHPKGLISVSIISCCRVPLTSRFISVLPPSKPAMVKHFRHARKLNRIFLVFFEVLGKCQVLFILYKICTEVFIYIVTSSFSMTEKTKHIWLGLFLNRVEGKITLTNYDFGEGYVLVRVLQRTSQ